jgi:hypothetical protein
MNFCKNILLISFLLIELNSFAQTDSIKLGKLEVKVIDAKTKKPIEFALVTIEKDSFRKSKYADNNGKVVFDNLPTETYNITTSFPGYSKTIIEDLILKDNKKTKKTIVLDSKTCNPVINIEREPNFKPDEPTPKILINKQIMRMPY